MAGRSLAAAAAALAIAAGARAGAPERVGPERGAPEWDAPCELARVDRGRTPSQRCIACHGDTADATAPRGRPTTHQSHPVEVDYAGAAARHPDDFVRAARLPPHVPLVDGKVACTSCHDGASRRRGRTVDLESLCTSCHRM
jgi:predicted CXXCH cytochrome family protein